LHEIGTGKASVFRGGAIAAAPGPAMMPPALDQRRRKMGSRLLRRIAAATWERKGLIGALSQGLVILIASLIAMPMLLLASAAVIFGILAMSLYVTTLFPTYSAEFYIKERDTTVTLAFYRVWDLFDSDGPMATEENSGRSVTVWTPDGQVTHKICGDDWPHWARTSVYLVGGHDLAIVGPHHCDYLVSTRPMAVARVIEEHSRDWIYLGAFDLIEQDGPPRAQVLRFIPADIEEECIIGKADQRTVRNEARRESCSHIRHRAF
jgi:hypothetical protein